MDPCSSFENDFEKVVPQIDLTLSDNETNLNCVDYFDISEKNNKFTSKCNICNKILIGKVKGNLMRHLRLIHKLGMKDAVISDDGNVRTLRVKISAATVYSACIEMCTINGRPLKALNDSGFQRLLQPILDAFTRVGIKISLTLPVIHDYLDVYAHRMKDEIKRDINGSMVCIKMDIVKRLRRSILGINAQYIKNDKIIIRTLNMREMRSSNSAEYICSMLLETLTDFGISQRQVFSITTDNGPNIVKSVDVFCEFAQSNDFAFDDDILQSALEEDLDDDDIEDSEQKDSEHEILRQVVQIFGNEFIKGFTCATHTVQLIVNHALGEKSKLNAAKLVQKFRQVSYMMGKPNILYLIKAEGLLFPKKDNATRWSSFFYMLERMQELRDFYERNEQIILGKKTHRKLTESDWNDMGPILKILKIFEVITTRLQAEQLTPSDFFAAWEELKLELEDLEGDLADELRRGIAIREPDLYNDVIFASVYLDPRYKLLLSKGR